MKSIYSVKIVTRTKERNDKFIDEHDFVLAVYEDKQSAINRAKDYSKFLIRHEHLKLINLAGTNLDDFDNLDGYQCVILGQHDIIDQSNNIICIEQYRMEIEEHILFEMGEP